MSVVVAGQTAGGDVEAAGQPGRPRRHGSGDAEGQRGGRRSVGRELEGWQPAAGETSSPGGRVDCSVHDLTPPHPLPQALSALLSMSLPVVPEIDQQRARRVFIELDTIHWEQLKDIKSEISVMFVVT